MVTVCLSRSQNIRVCVCEWPTKHNACARNWSLGRSDINPMVFRSFWTVVCPVVCSETFVRGFIGHSWWIINHINHIQVFVLRPSAEHSMISHLSAYQCGASDECLRDGIPSNWINKCVVIWIPINVCDAHIYCRSVRVIWLRISFVSVVTTMLPDVRRVPDVFDLCWLRRRRKSSQQIQRRRRRRRRQHRGR